MSALRLVRQEEPTISIPLAIAQLCSESSCNEIFSLSDGACPKCGSDGMSLERLLDKRPEVTHARP